MREAKVLQHQREQDSLPTSARQKPKPDSAPRNLISFVRGLQRVHGNGLVQRLLDPTLRRACSCEGQNEAGGSCPACAGDSALQRASEDGSKREPVPNIVNDVLRTQGTPLDQSTRAFMEPRFGKDLGDVRVHTDSTASESAKAVSSLAYTVGKHIVFREGLYQPGSSDGKKLLAHELTHTIQQAHTSGGEITGVSQPGDPCEQEAERTADQIMRMEDGQGERDSLEAESDGHSDAQGSLSRQSSILRDEESDAGTSDGSAQEEGIEVGEDLVLFPTWSVATLPPSGSAGDPLVASPLTGPQLQRSDICDTPGSFRKVTSGKFEGGKTLDDYYPDLVGTSTWGSKDTAGTFDNGTRAGSALQFIASYNMMCIDAGTKFNFSQQISIVRMRGDGKKLLENGKALEGQTIDDIARSKRDQSKAPFRQEWDSVISMADPISGAPYSMFTNYEFEANATTTITGGGGSLSVTWGVAVESKAKKLTKNVLT